MRGVPFTPCTLRLAWGDPPPVDTFLVTAAGSAYKVDRLAGRTLHCTRWPADEVPDDALVIEWRWAKRRRR